VVHRSRSSASRPFPRPLAALSGLLLLALGCQGQLDTADGFANPPPAVPPTPAAPAPAPAPAPTVQPTPAPSVTPAPVTPPPVDPGYPPPATPPATPPAPPTTAPPVIPPTPTPPATPPPGPPTSKRLVFVVGDANNPGQGDSDLLAFMESLGYQVDVADDADRSRDFRDDALVVISSSVNAAQLRDEWDTPQPVLVMSSGVFGEMRLTSGRNGDAGQQAARTIDIQDATHPTAAGLTGRVTISDQNAQLNFGTPSPGAKIVATINADPKRAAIFVYDAGAPLATASAAETARNARGRRVGFFLRQNDFGSLRKDGETLLEAALAWTWSGGAQ
jgi:hypothetical protein